MKRKSKDKLAFGETYRKIVSEECSLYNKSYKTLKKNKDGSFKRTKGKLEQEIQKNWCSMGHVCLPFDNKQCPAFSEEILNIYINMQKLTKEKNKK